jgi:hypothetical protein
VAPEHRRNYGVHHHSKRGRHSTPGSDYVRHDPAGLVDYWLEITAVAVDVGHLTQRMHIFHESHVPSQQT